MKIIRRKAFETNSSSCHSLTYTRSNNPMSYLQGWKEENPDIKQLTVTLKGYYNDPTAYSVDDKLSYIFSDLINHREAEFMTSEDIGNLFENGVSQEAIDLWVTGAFTKHTIDRDKLNSIIQKDDRMLRLVNLLKDKADLELEFTGGGTGWVGVDHESVGTGASIMRLSDEEIIEFLFNEDNYFELEAW